MLFGANQPCPWSQRFDGLDGPTFILCPSGNHVYCTAKWKWFSSEHEIDLQVRWRFSVWKDLAPRLLEMVHMETRPQSFFYSYQPCRVWNFRGKWCEVCAKFPSTQINFQSCAIRPSGVFGTMKIKLNPLAFNHDSKNLILTVAWLWTDDACCNSVGDLPSLNDLPHVEINASSKPCFDSTLLTNLGVVKDILPICWWPIGQG